MGATLYGAEGLWVGRLGGTNLFDAMLPEAVATFDGAKAIGQATKFSRSSYFLILAACAVSLWSSLSPRRAPGSELFRDPIARVPNAVL